MTTEPFNGCVLVMSENLVFAQKTITIGIAEKNTGMLDFQGTCQKTKTFIPIKFVCYTELHIGKHCKFVKGMFYSY